MKRLPRLPFLGIVLIALVAGLATPGLAQDAGTPDAENATWTNSIGATEFVTVWKDPEFDPSLSAFYYVRVIEIPTPRWTAYDVKYFGVEPPEGATMVTRERAYTSPIWYTP